MSSGKKSISPLRGREYAAAQIMRNSIAHAQYGDSSDALRAQYQLLYNIKLYSCTLRGELIAPEWSDIDLDNMELSISKFAEKIKGKVVTKAPKTRTSYPTVSPPSSVIALAQIQYCTLFFAECLKFPLFTGFLTWSIRDSNPWPLQCEFYFYQFASFRKTGKTLILLDFLHSTFYSIAQLLMLFFKFVDQMLTNLTPSEKYATPPSRLTCALKQGRLALFIYLFCEQQQGGYCRKAPGGLFQALYAIGLL